MQTPTIKRIELTPLFVPFRESVQQTMSTSEGGLGMAIPSEEAWLGGDFVIAQLTTEDGSVGLAEGFVWLPETGVSPMQLIDTIEHSLAHYMLGESPFDVARLRHRMDNNVARCDVAKGMLDMACYDLMGQITGRPAHDFMGGRGADAMPLAGLIPLLDATTMADISSFFVDSGTTTIRIKLGRNLEDDREITRQVREAIGPNTRLRVDYNQAYTADGAIRAIQAIEEFNIDVAEQPVRGNDWLGMVRVQENVGVPLMAHEGCFTLQEQITLIEMGAVQTVGINTERPGGITNALRAMDYAAQRSLGVILHNQPLGIASAVQVHLGAARADHLGHAMELFGSVMLEDDLIVEGLDYSGGNVNVPTGPGFGVELDRGALAKYSTGETRVIEG